GGVAARVLTGLRSIIWAAAVGVTVIAVLCLVFSGLIISGVVPVEGIIIFTAVSCFIGGASASIATGRRGKIMQYSLAILICMELMLWLIGTVLFQSTFVPGDAPFLVIALLLGLISGGVIANAR
ncbi:MAG: hypothetical protein IJF53_03795, partial [Clostridia bacterium]|nr:hypothetical protein [Clostridia bacterium]